MKNFTLYNGLEIPMIGYGTYKVTDADGVAVIEEAIRQGYRYLDTAAFYGNEAELGEAIRRSGVHRGELFLSTKVWREDMSYDNTMKSFEASCKAIGTDYLDLYMVHWPTSGTEKRTEWKADLLEVWTAIEELYRNGKIRSMGVCNFLPHHLLHLMNHGYRKPMVNQLEFHPGYCQPVATEFCREQEILVSAWSPIGRKRLMEEPLLLEIAGRYGKSVAQICLRFALQCEVLPIPKSSSAERMRANLDVFDFEISEEDMYRLLTMPQTGWSGEHPDFARVQI